jgi:hypothetical protein
VKGVGVGGIFKTVLVTYPSGALSDEPNIDLYWIYVVLKRTMYAAQKRRVGGKEGLWSGSSGRAPA